MLCEKCIPRELEAMRALESLTPSGSEFVNDPKRCAEFVKYNQQNQSRVIIMFGKRKKELAEALEFVLSRARGTSGRIILAQSDEDYIYQVLHGAKLGQMTEEEKTECRLDQEDDMQRDRR